MKTWHVVLIAIAAILLTVVVMVVIHKAKLKKAAETGKIEISKQSYTLVKVINPIVPANKTELSKVVNADGSTTVTYTDGTTSIIPKAS